MIMSICYVNMSICQYVSMLCQLCQYVNMLQQVEFINFTKKECISISLHFISIVDNQAAQKFDDNSQKICRYH